MPGKRGRLKKKYCICMRMEKGGGWREKPKPLPFFLPPPPCTVYFFLFLSSQDDAASAAFAFTSPCVSPLSSLLFSHACVSQPQSPFPFLFEARLRLPALPPSLSLPLPSDWTLPIPRWGHYSPSFDQVFFSFFSPRDPTSEECSCSGAGTASLCLMPLPLHAPSSWSPPSTSSSSYRRPPPNLLRWWWERWRWRPGGGGRGGNGKCFFLP